MADREIHWGTPGERFVNDGSRPLYQFVATLQNTCGACLQYHLAIGPWWPIKIHRRCNCEQFVVRPGATAPHPFCDFRELLDNMSHRNQVAAIGASNYALLRAGVVDWKEIVTRYRVRTLREVIAINKVSEKTALAAGVKPGVAKVAYAAVKAPEAEMIRQHRAELTRQITAAGVPHEQLVRQIGEAIVNRVTIVGSSGAQSMATVGARPTTLAERAAEIARLLAAARAARPKPGTTTLPRGATIVVGDGVVTVRDGGRETVVRPGERAFGMTYEELRRRAGK